MNIVKKLLSIINLTISYKTLLVSLIITFCLLLFPMLYISKWNVPAVDDFANGAEVHQAFLGNKSFVEIILIIVERTKNIYFQWQGTLSAVFLFNLMPALFGDQYESVGFAGDQKLHRSYRFTDI